MEQWRPVFVGILAIPSGYHVSDLGRVRRGGLILKPYRCPTRNGLYWKVDLWISGKRHQRFVHRLVAMAFLENPQLKPEVNHEDTDPANNRLDNLSWMTRIEQEAHKRFMEA